MRHLTLHYRDTKAAQEIGNQVVKLLPKSTNLSSYTIPLATYVNDNVLNELKSMIEEFMIHQPTKRLKPLNIIVKN